jgi:hypothetical protein
MGKLENKIMNKEVNNEVESNQIINQYDMEIVSGVIFTHIIEASTRRVNRMSHVNTIKHKEKTHLTRSFISAEVNGKFKLCNQIKENEKELNLSETV